MTTTRYIKPDKFRVPSAFEIDDGFLDLIQGGSIEKDDKARKVYGDMVIRFGEHPTLGGWTASRPINAVTWVFACCADDARPGNLKLHVSPDDIELDADGEVPAAISGEIFDGEDD